MKILFLSNEGLAYVLGWRMAYEGHEVKMYIKDPADRKGGDGFIPKVSDWKAELPWCDYVICDDVGWGKVNDAIRAMGIPVVGGTELSDAMEEDRGTGQRMFEALGMETLKSHEFKNIEEAISYVEENPRKYVIKVSGKSQVNKMSTYVGQMEDGSDIGPVLKHMGKGQGIESVQVQDAVSGIEVGIGGFFNGKDFMDPVNLNFEHKKLMNGGMEGGQAGIGPNTGEMGTALFHRDKGFKLYEETIARFIPVLRKTGYIGDFDINCILEFDPLVEGMYRIRPLEMTNRFGWPTIPLQIETMKINDLGDLFYGMATGKATNFRVTHSHSVCVVIGCPPLPYKDQKLADIYSTDMPVTFRHPDSMDGIYPGDVYMDSEGTWRVTGDTGCPVVCAAGADTLLEAKTLAYERVLNVIVPNKMYRTDISDNVEMALKSIPSLIGYEGVPV